MRFQNPLIVGGGPAGSAAAIALAMGGAKPVIFERQAIMGDALCGGFLSWHTLAALERLGIGRNVLGGHAIDRVRIFAGARQAEALLPAGAIGVSRHRLDTVMLSRAETVGAVVEHRTVRRADGRTLSIDEDMVEADSLFLATGKHDLRGLARPRDEKRDPTLGLRIRIAAHPGLSGMVGPAIELHLFDRGYAGLLLQEDGTANLCMAVRKSRLTKAGGQFPALLAALGKECPALAERVSLADTIPDADAIAAVPYGWRALATEPGVFRLGDQAAVIPSLAGEGVGIAIASGMAAAEAWLKSGADGAQAYQRDFAARSRRPVAVAKWLWERGETPWAAALAARLLSFAPSLAQFFARATRIGD